MEAFVYKFKSKTLEGHLTHYLVIFHEADNGELIITVVQKVLVSAGKEEGYLKDQFDYLYPLPQFGHYIMYKTMSFRVPSFLTVANIVAEFLNQNKH